MGKAVITENRGDSLYRARPVYDTSRLEKEKAALELVETTYPAKITAALLSVAYLSDEKDIALAAYNRVIKQWKDGLLTVDAPPPPLPADPEVYPEPDRAQDGPLFDAINAARTAAGKAALTRDGDLDVAARRHAYDLDASRGYGHIGSDRSTPEHRTANAGYAADLVIEEVSCGAPTPEDAADDWATAPSATASGILASGVTDIGVAHAYSTNHPATMIWVAVLCHADPSPPVDPPTLSYPDDPAQKAAREQEAALSGIDPPRTDPDMPAQLGKVVAAFALAAQKLRAAETEMARLLAERLERLDRIAAITAELAELAALNLDVWMCRWNESLAVGSEIVTADVPGWWRDEAVAKIYATDGDTLPYLERSWNLCHEVSSTTPASQLHLADSMPASAIFANAALEPGHTRWKPIWRYGVVVLVDTVTSTCTLTLADDDTRMIERRGEYGKLTLDPAPLTLENVPISYPPCGAEVFAVGDEVLILFEGFNRDTPKVVGFRREPKQCPARVSWTELF